MTSESARTVCDGLLSGMTKHLHRKLILSLSLCSPGGSGEVQGHALVSAGSERPEGHQPELTTHADCSWRRQPMWVQHPFKSCHRLLFIYFLFVFDPFLVLVTAGSISSCDAFLNVFQARGLRPEVICPCASSSEAMTVAIRRSALNYNNKKHRI